LNDIKQLPPGNLDMKNAGASHGAEH
jgi:hypothetical protein